MLYGMKDNRDIILEKVKEFEEKYQKKVVFGSMVGSISKGVERFDSDYDTRFLYLDKTETGYFRWDQLKEDIKESQIHQCYIPEKDDLFYDKIAFWELTSFINFLRNPQLDRKFSVGLFHIVGWTLNSPYCWDPYGIKSKIVFLLDEMFQKSYEIQYYRNYITKCLQRKPCRLREYFYSCYYLIAIQYCLEYNRFPPIYFPTLLEYCKDDELKVEIERLKKEYYETSEEMYRQNPAAYKRKMANYITVERNETVDKKLINILDSTKEYECLQKNPKTKDYVEDIIEIIFDSFRPPIVKDVNELMD